MSETIGYEPSEAASFVAPSTSETHAQPNPLEPSPVEAEVAASQPEHVPEVKSYAERVADIQASTKELGSGLQKTVYPHPTQPDHVLGVYHTNNWTTGLPYQERFYTRKLLHLLLPENIPDIHLSTSEPATVVTDRVRPLEENWVNRLKHKISDPFERAAITREVRKITGLNLDGSNFNFIRGQHGKLVYVDDPADFLGLDPESEERLKAEIKQRLSPEQQQLAETYIERLKIAHQRIASPNPQDSN